ncbi:trypsin-like peptidase domain-containing protein [Streptomyces sp. NBC_00656]|uniref:caspase, EACC1-associated type n=1 Tax=Streptomyces sp. NBC_00656 TaxID=2903668 RepID=UPI00324B3A20
MANVLSRGDSSSVVLIGCHSFTALDPLPAVENNLTSLQNVLSDKRVWGVPEHRVEVLSQLTATGKPLNAEYVLSAAERAAEAATDTLVVYYAGHGLIHPNKTEELYLALPESSKGYARVRSALPFSDLRDVIRHSNAARKVVLLDCCYSARAMAGEMGSGEATDLVNKAEVEGTCVITAASETAVALAPPGAKFTAFTGVLLETLRNGVPDVGELIDMESLYDEIYIKLQHELRPLPQMQARNRAAQICIARNRAPALALLSTPRGSSAALGYQPDASEALGLMPPRRGGSAALSSQPDASEADLAGAQVRIYATSQEDELIGSGFLVAADVVCTNVHVVAMALGLPVNTEPKYGVLVELDFPLLSGQPRTRAEVEFWDSEKDVARLRLVAAVEGSWPAPHAGGTGVWQHPFRVLGFPSSAPDGIWVWGTLRARQALGWVQMEVHEPGPRISAGFSGAPVWDAEQGGVVGMMVAVDGGGRTAYLISWADLVDPKMLQPRCPFPGPRTFTQDDAEFFHGRDADIDRVYTAVLREAVTLVVGPSGCGKSSVVRAGVLPRLRADGMSVSELCLTQILPTVPSLVEVLTRSLELDLGDVGWSVKDGTVAGLPGTGGDALAELRGRILARREGIGHVLFVDQLEYVGADPATMRDLFTVLAALSGQAGAAVLRVVATARPSSLDMLVTPGTSDLVGNAVFLAPLAGGGLQLAITAPVDSVPGLRIEPGLPERIVADAGNEPGRMPLVQSVLAELWHNRTRSTLTHAAYDSFGGVPGALVRCADRVYDQLSQEQRECFRGLLVQLTQAGSGDTFVGRSVRTAALDPPAMDMARRLAHDRLVVLSPAPRGAEQEEIVDLAHESLIRLWPRLSRWLFESRDSGLWQKRLRADLNRWEDQNRDPSLLLRGADLADADRRMAMRPQDMSADEREYILLSKLFMHHARRHVLLKRAAIGALAVLTVLAAVLALSFA